MAKITNLKGIQGVQGIQGIQGIQGANGPAGTFNRCFVYASTLQVITKSTFPALTFDTEITDSDGFHDTTTNNSRLTIPTGLGGIYQIFGTVFWAGSTSGNRVIVVHKNGVSVDIPGLRMQNLGQSVKFGQSINGVMALAQADYIELIVNETATVNLNSGFESDSMYNSFGLLKIG